MKQSSFDLSPTPSYAKADFIVSGCNQLAWQWLESWPKWPAYGAVLVGPKACGKTHLLHCWTQTSHARPLSEDQPLPMDISQPVAIDNADGWRSPEAEERLFHLLNQVKAAGQTLLLTASSAPAFWPIALSDLRSRLLSLPVWELEPPDDTLLETLIAKQFSDRQLLVDSATVQYIVSRTERSFEAVQHSIAALDQFALQSQRPITPALVRQWLSQDICAP